MEAHERTFDSTILDGSLNGVELVGNNNISHLNHTSHTIRLGLRSYYSIPLMNSLVSVACTLNFTLGFRIRAAFVSLSHGLLAWISSIGSTDNNNDQKKLDWKFLRHIWST